MGIRYIKLRLKLKAENCVLTDYTQLAWFHLGQLSFGVITLDSKKKEEILELQHFSFLNLSY